MEPPEVDTPEDLPQVPGVKNAAVRKLLHELGITELKPEQFHYITRLHYWAADTVTHGPNSPWGEHEIDYVLLAVVPRNSITLQPHPDEVDATAWVSQSKLETMLADTKLLFSPWFRIIYHKWLKDWWTHLETTLAAPPDVTTIHRFDPPLEHLGGAGKAQPQFTKGDAR